MIWIRKCQNHPIWALQKLHLGSCRPSPPRMTSLTLKISHWILRIAPVSTSVTQFTTLIAGCRPLSRSLCKHNRIRKPEMLWTPQPQRHSPLWQKISLIPAWVNSILKIQQRLSLSPKPLPKLWTSHRSWSRFPKVKMKNLPGTHLRSCPNLTARWRAKRFSKSMIK